jgi:guanyl-specific ribonuclease Sa
MKKILFLIVFVGLAYTFQGDIGQVLQNMSAEPVSTLAGIGAPQSELDATLSLIKRGGPFPNSRDGIVFENREKLLPGRERGYYREYTVPTPGANHRGARRVVSGGNPPEVFYYTEDHYQSFREIKGK